ncbi:MAG: SMP-30/gluconolactonase/LRE family protein [Metallosphaera sp.]|uniref:SMP-30/gluconolactonase/LRE family protein n=1 Tax=Metallosphaera sp. TaxID=2020860 RepID=UPI0031720171
MNPSIFVRSKAVLGEGPVWDSRNKTLYWVDILGGKLHVVREGKDEEIDSPSMISALGLTKDEGKLVVAAGLSLYRYSNGFHLIGKVEERGVRFNDGKCGPDGKFWVGTMDLEEKKNLGKLFVFDGEFKVKQKNLTVSNGMDWYKDMYYLVDSPKRRIYAFRVRDDELVSLGAAIETEDYPGVPDGMVVDSEGLIWVAHYGGGMITVWEPFSKRPVNVIKTPVKIVTSLTFGGEGLNQVFITSSSKGGEELAGSVFVMETESKGREHYICKSWENI